MDEQKIIQKNKSRKRIFFLLVLIDLGLIGIIVWQIVTAFIHI